MHMSMQLHNSVRSLPACDVLSYRVLVTFGQIYRRFFNQDSRIVDSPNYRFFALLFDYSLHDMDQPLPLVCNCLSTWAFVFGFLHRWLTHTTKKVPLFNKCVFCTDFSFLFQFVYQIEKLVSLIVASIGFFKLSRSQNLGFLGLVTPPWFLIVPKQDVVDLWDFLTRPASSFLAFINLGWKFLEAELKLHFRNQLFPHLFWFELSLALCTFFIAFHLDQTYSNLRAKNNKTDLNV